MSQINNMKILISTWGNPKGWDEVIYYYKGEKRKLKDTSRLIKEKEGIEKTIIVSIDTLFDECALFLSQISYQNIKNLSQSFIQNFCKRESGYNPDKVIISYGVGEFNNSKFIGNAMDFYYSVFKELSFTFVEWLEGNSSTKSIDVYLDISHGINFLPVLTYRALREILQILAYDFELKLIVLNSDTYIRTAKPDVLNINAIEESKILPKMIAYKNPKRCIEPYFGLGNREKCDIGRNIGKNFSINDEIMYFLSAFMYALPVFAIKFLPNKGDLKKGIEEVVKKFEESILITDSSKKIEIKRNIEFTLTFENLIKAYLISWLLNKKGIYQKDEIELEEIKKIKEEIWKDKFPVESNRIDVEIERINELSSSLFGQYKTYAEIKGKSISNNIDKRNFFAHAGFEHNSIMLRKANDKIILKVNNVVEEQIKRLLEDNLPRS